MMRRRHRYADSVKLWPGNAPWRPPFPVETGVSPPHFKMPLPESDAEFAILTEIFFGKQLTLRRLWIYQDAGQAEIAEPYDSFGDRHYDKLSWFLRTIFGPMHCSSSLTYTDFKRYGHRMWARLLRWEESRRKNDSRAVRTPFVRLAHRFGVGENIVPRVDRRGRGVLIDGREDGASAGSPLKADTRS